MTSTYAPTDLADYPYECSCGERYSSVDAAWHCRKCRSYTDEGYCTFVTDLRTDEVVKGELPPELRPEPKPYVPETWTQPTLADVLGR